MNNALNVIMNQLEQVFAELDEKLVKESVEWVMKKYDDYIAYISSDEYKDRTLSYDYRWNKTNAICGGRTYRNMFEYGKEETKKRATKKAKATIQSRNASIAAKLIKAEITQVTGSSFTYTNDGFNGTFSVETNKGTKTVVINTIYAGGYNIQCFHIRVLVKVK